MALAIAGSSEEAVIAADGLIEATEATNNAFVFSYALLGCGVTYRDVDPMRALEALRRAVTITRNSGNRFVESHLAHLLSGLEAKHGDLVAAVEHITLAIHNYHNAGSVAFIHDPLASLAALLDWLGRFEPAATIAAFAALSPITLAVYPELVDVIAHLRDVLGDQTYDGLARTGATMNTAAMAAYAYDQIDQARTELKAVSE